MRIVLAGIIGRYPWGGVTWCSLMYLLGLARLGHDVWYLEDTCECNYDPEANAVATDPAYALRYLERSLKPFGFGQRWCYVDYQGGHHGIEENAWKAICRSADILLVLSGGVWIWRDNYRSIPVKAFIDSDPGFTQLAIEQAVKDAERDSAKRWYCDFFHSYDRLFSFGGCIGQTDCTIPTSGLVWLPTTQPICLDLWKPSSLPPRGVWTTVMTWVIESFKDVGGNKDQEFLKVLDLPSALGETPKVEFELAVNGPRSFLGGHGWTCLDAFTVSSDLWRYHSYLTSSRAEFSVAKHTYVRTRSGWMSDRTACYLAAGRPAVVQETGLSSWIPTGEGLLTWTTKEEAVDAVRSVELDYQRHSQKAANLAAEYLSSNYVLKTLLERL